MSNKSYVDYDPAEQQWVKIPGLDPREENALRLLNREELHKLAVRVHDAQARMDTAREGRRTVPPAGSRVRHLDLLRYGTVIDSSLLSADFYNKVRNAAHTRNNGAIKRPVWVLWDGQTTPSYTSADFVWAV